MREIFKYLFFTILFSSCAQHVVFVDHVVDKNIRIDEKMTSEDQSITKIIAPYKERLDSEMNEIIGKTEIELIKSSPESTLGNWFADIIMEESTLLDNRVSFAIQNRGGFRINSIAKGDITKRKIFELMPFDNFLVIMEADGKTVKKLAEHITKDGGWPISKNLKITLMDSIITELLIDGNPVEDNQIYFFTLPDYVANGGSNSQFLRKEKRVDTGHMIRDLALKNIRAKTAKGILMTSELDGRITINHK